MVTTDSKLAPQIVCFISDALITSGYIIKIIIALGGQKTAQISPLWSNQTWLLSGWLKQGGEICS